MAKMKSLSDQVYEHIIEKIKYGELTEGEKIDEAALIEEIGTSRTQILEAIKAKDAGKLEQLLMSHWCWNNENQEPKRR